MNVSVHSPWALLALGGELDIARIDEITQMAATAMEGDRFDLVVDLTNVTFIDSSGLGWLIRLQDQLDRSAGHMRIVGSTNGSLKRLLSITGLEDHFHVVETLKAAEADPIGGMTQAIDELLVAFIDPDPARLIPHLKAAASGDDADDVWKRATEAGYTEWTGLGYRFTDKGRERGRRLQASTN
jgi:anti-sigma B factor antagonist